MPRNKVLERAKVTAPSGRNAFDLSNMLSATSLAGELNCVYAQPVIAGTKGKISRRCFTRTANVVSPAFHRVTEHFDFFIVPIHSLWRQWNDWKVNINDMKDTNLVPWNASAGQPDLALPQNCPRLDFLNLVETAQFLNPNAVNPASYVRQANDLLKLTEAMGYGESVAMQPTQQVPARVMNTFVAGAYQKVYYEHYRNTAYESNNPYAYNFDWLYDGVRNGQFDLSQAKDRQILRPLFQMRRVNYRNDYFHNIYPALNYVASAPNGLSGFSLPVDVGGASSSPNSNQWFIGVSNSPSSPRLYQTSSNIASNNQWISAQSIRAVFALDKLMRASAYAPKHVKEQWKALYGVDTVDDPDMRSNRIGSFESEVTFQEVTNMTGSGSPSDPPLGFVGAKGVGGDDKDKFIDFYAKEDSIIIGLHYYLPRAMYDAYGIHPFNIKIQREAFFNKFFENLGLRPFYLYYIDGTGFRVSSAGANVGMVMAWTVPNMDLKIRPDLNTGAFKQEFCEYAYDSSQTSSYNKYTSQTSNLRTYVPHNSNIAHIKDNPNGITAEYFKVAPEDLDNVFRVSVPVDHKVSYYQFYGLYRITMVTVAGMSVHGQPSL